MSVYDKEKEKKNQKPYTMQMTAKCEHCAKINKRIMSTKVMDTILWCSSTHVKNILQLFNHKVLK